MSRAWTAERSRQPGETDLIIPNGVSFDPDASKRTRHVIPNEEAVAFAHSILRAQPEPIAGATFVPHGDPELLLRYKMALVVRRDIEMSKGKIAAQCGHAVALLVGHGMSNGHLFEGLTAEGKARHSTFAGWWTNGMRKIVLKCSSLAQLEQLAKNAESAGLPIALVCDAGLTEVEPGTMTVLGIGPATQDEINTITSALKVL